MLTRKILTKIPVSPPQIWVLIIAVFLVPIAAYAQTLEPAPPPAAPAERRYLVEVIIFNYRGAISSGGELWQRESQIQFDPDMYATTPEYSVTTTVPENPNPETRADENPVRYTELKHLSPYLQKLSSDPGYELITKIAWTQPLFEKREAVQVPVAASPPDALASGQPYAPINPPVTGNIQVYENRLLFVDIDISVEIPTEVPDFSQASSARPPGVYRIQEKRRVKLNELHYFDHPFFGALVRVSRVEPGT